MANFTRTHLHFFANPDIPESEEEYQALAELVEAAAEGEPEGLYEMFELDPCSDYVYFDENCLEDTGFGIEIGVFSKGFFPIYNLTEAILDNYSNLSLYAVWCDEFEKSFEVPDEDWRETLDFDSWFNNHLSGGAFRHVMAGWDEENEEAYTTANQEEYNGKPNEKECWLWPRTPEMRHQIFVMAWDGWRPPDGGSRELFFNQCGLDETKIMVGGKPLVGEPDTEGFPGETMWFEEWIERVFAELNKSR